MVNTRVFVRESPEIHGENEAMMFRDTPDGTIAITQPSHAWLSGQIIRAWGNPQVGTVTPHEDVCLGAEQHDIGWLAWEQAPTLNSATGRPHSFRELSIAEHTAIWRRGTGLVLVFGRYPALLVSLHGSGLYEAFDATSANSADAVIVRDFLSEQREIQRRLIAGLRADEQLDRVSAADAIERNRDLVRAADRMSIAICTGLRDVAIRAGDHGRGIVRRVPAADGEIDLQLSAIDGDLARIAVSPWPFAAPIVRVSCEGIMLPSRPFDDEAKMRVALRDARKVVLRAELTPG